MKRSTVRQKNLLRGMKVARPLPRKGWGVLNPTTKVVESEKKYNRNKEKHNVKRDFECEG